MIINRWCFSVLLLYLSCGFQSTVGESKLDVKFSWKQLQYDWPSRATEEMAIETGQYIPENNFPLGLERWRDKIFLTVPRYNLGVVSSLNFFDLNSKEQAPILKPYPSWEANLLPLDVLQRQQTGNDICSDEGQRYPLLNNSTLISAMRVQVDACDRLWVIDSGLSDIDGDKKQIAPNAVVIFDLQTNTLLRRFNIPKAQIHDDTSLVNIVVESDASDCAGAYAYLPDLGTYSLIVYSYRENRSFRVRHNYFHSDPLQGDFNVDGIRFQWDGGLFGMAVGAKQTNTGNRDIYFHSLASYKEYKVSNSVLQNETYVTTSAAYDDFQYLGERGDKGQSTTGFYDASTNVLFYTLINQDAIGCWQVGQPYETHSGIVETNAEILPYPNDIKLDREGNAWILSNRLPTWAYGKLDPNAENYIITMGKTKELVKGTACEGKKTNYSIL